MKLEKTNYTGVLKSDKDKYYIRFKNVEGVSVRRVTTAKTAKEAKRLLEEKRHEIADIKAGKLSAVNIDRSIDTIDQLAEVFFSHRETKNNVADFNRYKKWVRPVVGSVKHPISLMQMERLQKRIKDSTVGGDDVNSKGVSVGKPEREIAPATVNDIMSLFGSMLRWGVKRKLILYIDGVPTVDKLAVSNERERVLNRDEIAVMLDAFSTTSKGYRGMDGEWYDNPRHKRETVRRNRLAVMLGLYTGARPISYLGLRAKDIDLERGWISFGAVKSAKAYAIPIADKLRLELEVAMLELSPNDKLFEASGESIRKSIQLVLNRLFNVGLEITDVYHRVTMYTLRHTSATLMLEKTGDVYLCSKLLGHSSVKTTQRYAKVNDQNLMDGVNMI